MSLAKIDRSRSRCPNADAMLKPPSLPINPKVKGIEPQQDEMVSHIFRLPYPWSGGSQGQEIYTLLYCYLALLSNIEIWIFF